MTTRYGRSAAGVDLGQEMLDVVGVEIVGRDVRLSGGRSRVHVEDAALELGNAGIAGERQRALADELHAVVLRRVVRRRHRRAAVETAIGDAEVEHLGGDHAEAGHPGSGGLGADRKGGGELGRRQPRIVPDGQPASAELGGQRGADAPGAFGVELLRVQAANVVGLEDIGRDGHRPSTPSNSRNFTAPSASTVPGNRQQPLAITLSAPIRQPSPTTAFTRWLFSPTTAPLTTTLRSTLALGPTVTPSCTTDSTISAPASTTQPAPITASGPTRLPGARVVPPATCAGGTTLAPGATTASGATNRYEGPRSLETLVAMRALQQVEVSLEIAFGGADVAPVRVGDEGVQPAGGGKLRKHAALDRERPPGRDHVEHLGLEQVDAGVDQGAVRRHRVLGARLFDELHHAAVVGDLDQAVAARVVDPREQDRRQSLALSVEGAHRREVDVGEDVAVEGEQAAAVELALHVLDGAGGAQRLLFDYVAHGEAVAAAVADRVLESMGQIAGRKHGPLYAVAREVLEDVADERPADQGHDRLGHARGDRPQPGALTADQDDRLSAG